jgi:hypothetical protein
VDIDGHFIDDKGDFEVIFKAICVAVTPERPHGLKYTLVLIDAKGERVVCFDNAHSLVSDFWVEVDKLEF